MSARTILMTTFLALFAPNALANDDPEPPKPGPIGVRLVAKKSTYTLDFRGHKKEDYLKEARVGKVQPPSVDLELVITNHTKGFIRLRSAGSTNRLTLTLKGDGAVSARSDAGFVRVPIQYTVLKPGEKLTIPITQLSSLDQRGKKGGTDTYHYWTEAGEYTLSASFYTLVGLDYNGGNPMSSYKTLESKPIKIKVER